MKTVGFCHAESPQLLLGSASCGLVSRDKPGTRVEEVGLGTKGVRDETKGYNQ